MYLCNTTTCYCLVESQILRGGGGGGDKGGRAGVYNNSKTRAVCV